MTCGSPRLGSTNSRVPELQVPAKPDKPAQPGLGALSQDRLALSATGLGTALCRAHEVKPGIAAPGSGG